eukprot:scaffold246_cov414-Prasinococcus_capsulatus_cf.AAC.31
MTCRAPLCPAGCLDSRLAQHRDHVRGPPGGGVHVFLLGAGPPPAALRRHEARYAPSLVSDGACVALPQAKEYDGAGNELQATTTPESCSLTVDRGKLRTRLHLETLSSNCTLTAEMIDDSLVYNKEAHVLGLLADFQYKVYANETEVPLPVVLSDGTHAIRVESTVTGFLDSSFSPNPQFVLESNSTGAFDCDTSPPQLSVAYPPQVGMPTTVCLRAMSKRDLDVD